jgi:hypothetical protein
MVPDSPNFLELCCLTPKIYHPKMQQSILVHKDDRFEKDLILSEVSDKIDFWGKLTFIYLTKIGLEKVKGIFNPKVVWQKYIKQSILD